MQINLENFDQEGRSRPIINSPRSIQACLRQGIKPDELIKQPLEAMKKLYPD